MSRAAQNTETTLRGFTLSQKPYQDVDASYNISRALKTNGSLFFPKLFQVSGDRYLTPTVMMAVLLTDLAIHSENINLRVHWTPSALYVPGEHFTLAGTLAAGPSLIIVPGTISDVCWYR